MTKLTGEIELGRVVQRKQIDYVGKQKGRGRSVGVSSEPQVRQGLPVQE